MNAKQRLRTGITEQAMKHCAAAITVRVGQCGLTQDRHVVERLSATDWVVREAPRGSRYPEGMQLKGGVIFWRMGGMLKRVAFGQARLKLVA